MAYRGTRIVWRGTEIEAVSRAAAARGLNMAAERLRAIVVPFTPFLEGDLTNDYGVHQATPESISEGAQLQNASKYAAFQHEGGDGTRTIRRHTTEVHPQARTKFVEVPFRDNAEELQGIIAAQIAAGLA